MITDAMRRRLAFIVSSASAVMAALWWGTVGAASGAAATAARISALADVFYVAPAHFDPLNYATANGDSRFDDQIGMSIAPKIRSRYFAHIHRLRAQLASITFTTLSDADKLNEKILAFELEDSLDLEVFPEHLLPIN